MGQMGQDSGNRGDVSCEVMGLARRLPCSGILRDLADSRYHLYHGCGRELLGHHRHAPNPALDMVEQRIRAETMGAASSAVEIVSRSNRLLLSTSPDLRPTKSGGRPADLPPRLGLLLNPL